MRPVTCECGECRRCSRRAYNRAWLASKPAGYNSGRIAKWRAENPDATKKHAHEHYMRNRGKQAARSALGRALKRGEVVRPDACEACGSNGRIDGHHDDYSKPLEVKWLCRPCHGAVHRSAA